VSVPQDTLGFGIEYRSLSDLDEDHRSHIKQGRMVVAWTARNPNIGQRIYLTLEVPGGGQYALIGTVSRNAAGKGFAIDISAESKATQHELDQLVSSHPFQQALRVESPSTKNTRAVGTRTLPRGGAVAPAPPPAPIPAATTGSTKLPGIAAATTGSAKLPAPAGIPAATTGSAKLPAPGLPAPAPSGLAAPSAAVAKIDDLSLDDEDDDEEGAVDKYDDYDDDIYGEEDEEGGSQTSDEDEAQNTAPGAFRTPGPGEKYALYIVKFKTVIDFSEVVQTFRETAQLLVPHPNDISKEGDLAQLRLTLPGRNVFSIWALVGKARPTDVMIHVNPDSPTFALALAFPKSVAGSRRAATEKESDRGKMEVLRLTEERSKEDLDAMPVRRRVQRMSMEDKINMALSGGREERMALAMDGNKAIHHYLLRNARLSLDEITFMTRLPTMNPDVLAKIAENPQYTQNITVVKNLVYNPKTPILLAIKLLDRLPRSEVMSLAKRMSMNGRLVQAAKKKIGNK